MVYSIGSPEDEKLHRVHHASVLKEVRILIEQKNISLAYAKGPPTSLLISPSLT